MPKEPWRAVKKLPVAERQRRVSEGLRLSWARRKAEQEARHKSRGNATKRVADDFLEFD